MEGKEEMEGFMDQANDAVDFKLEMPEFASEAEEAAWWPTQEDKLLEAFEKAARQGTLKRASFVRKAASPVTSLALDASEIELAQKQAEAKGVPYQAYLEGIVREALHKAS